MRTAIEKGILLQGLSLILLILTICSLPAFAGDLNPGAPPAPTMKTLDQIPPTWDQVLPASERFKLVMGGAAVLDKETGLVWEQNPPISVTTWSSAISLCISKSVGDRRGWRLPTIEELASLVDPNNPGGNPDLPPGHPFTNVQSSPYWSSSTFINNTANAWYVDFSNSFVTNTDKTNFTYYLCVRGGQGHDAY